MNHELSLKFEKAVIGAMIIEKTALGRMSIQPMHLQKQSHKRLMEAVIKLSEKNIPIDILSVNKEVGGDLMGEIMELTALVTSAAHIEYHCSVIYESYVFRTMMLLCQQTQLKLMEDDVDVFNVLQEFSANIDGFSIKNSRDFIELYKAVNTTIKEIEVIQESKKSVIGLDTGFKAMNEISHGIHAPDLIIIAARPATGKTAFALNLATNIALQKTPVAFFSLEMSTKQLAMRVMSSMTGVYSNYFTKADLQDYNWATIINTDFNIPMYIDDTPSLNIIDFKEKSRRAKKQWNIGAIVVDYLQLMTVYGKGNREQEISTISRTLKGIAKELNVPVIALAQLSRDVEKSNREPRLSDLRESGAIEQDADIVITLHNESEFDSPEPTIKVIYLKHRNGEVGYFRLTFEKGRQKFKDFQ